MKLIKNLFGISSILVIMFSVSNVKAQDFGADVVSSYVWRGTQFGTGPAIQPWFTLPTITDGLELGAWGSFAVAGGDHQIYEFDLYATYDFGPVALTVTNYTFPQANGVYEEGSGLFDGDLEVAASGSVGPVGLTVGYFTDLGAMYVEAGVTVAGIDIAVGYGSDDDAEAADFYAAGEDESGLVNVSLGGSKEIKITEDYSLPVFGSFVYNPTAEAAYMVFGFSF